MESPDGDPNLWNRHQSYVPFRPPKSDAERRLVLSSKLTELSTYHNQKGAWSAQALIHASRIAARSGSSNRSTPETSSGLPGVLHPGFSPRSA